MESRRQFANSPPRCGLTVPRKLPRLPDPVLALARLTCSIRQTVLPQERLDEDNETREQRLACDKAAAADAGTTADSSQMPAFGADDRAGEAGRPRAAPNGHDPP